MSEVGSSSSNSSRRSSLTPSRAEEAQASLQRVFDELAEEVKCALCLELFDKPVVLKCLHTFCSACLNEIAISEENTITCPLCRHTIELGSKGIAGLKVNYHLLNIVEKMRKARAKRCDECQTDFATEHCKQCKANLCESCGLRIHSLRLMMDHTRFPISIDDNFSDDLFEVPIEDPMRPDDMVVDFSVRRDMCLELLRKWESTLWFAPFDMRASNSIRHLKAMLIPYWLFEVETSSRYHALITRLLSQMRTSETAWSRAADTCTGMHRQLVCATDCLEASILTKLEPWDVDSLTSANTPTHTTSLSMTGHRAQALPFALDESKAFSQNVEDQVKQIQKQVCERHLRDRVGMSGALKDVNIETTFTRVGVQRVYLPVYIVRFVYNGKSFLVVVNGQTGKLCGERPYSVGKVATVGLTGIGALLSIFRSR